jgi:tRNA(Arg) A34 adenosine deaminase TadA
MKSPCCIGRMVPGGIQDREFFMTASRLALCAGALTLLGIGAIASTTSVSAQNAREAELIGFHQLCDKGDRKACIRFGIMLGENRQRHVDWRKAHPEFWWWEH